MANAQMDVTALLDLINSSVKKLTAAYGHANQPIPHLSGVVPPRPGTPDLHNNVDVAVLAAACDQLKATFVDPEQELFAVSHGHQLSAALSVAIEARVAEGLRRAPPQGVHIDVLARPSGLDPQTLARCLRLLADNHIFREVSPDSFAYTRLSLPLDTGKLIDFAFSGGPGHLYTGTDGIVAMLAMNCAHGSRTSARLLDWLQVQRSKEQSAETDSPNGSLGWIAPTPFQLAFGTKQTYFEWLGTHPEQQALFQAAMVGHASIRSSKGYEASIGQDLPWSRLSNSDLVVDVGGGNGSALLPIVEAYPHVRFIVQDLNDVESQFNAFWEDANQPCISSGRIKFQVHDFFDQNPVSKAAIYYLRNVLHDWPDSEAANILRRVAEAAGPASYIMINELVTPTAEDSSAAPDGSSPSEHAGIPGITALPAPLTTPTAYHGGVVHRYDLTMLCLCASAERTASQWRRLLDEVGLRIAHVIPGSYSGSAKPGTLVCVKK